MVIAPEERAAWRAAHHTYNDVNCSDCDDDWPCPTLRLLDEVERWALALQSLTPGGSEYANDPTRCVRFVRETRTTQHEAIKKSKGDADALRAQLGEVRMMLREVAERLHEVDEHWQLASHEEGEQFDTCGQRACVKVRAVLLGGVATLREVLDGEG